MGVPCAALGLQVATVGLRGGRARACACVQGSTGEQGVGQWKGPRGTRWVYLVVHMQGHLAPTRMSGIWVGDKLHWLELTTPHGALNLWDGVLGPQRAGSAALPGSDSISLCSRDDVIGKVCFTRDTLASLPKGKVQGGSPRWLCPPAMPSLPPLVRQPLASRPLRGFPWGSRRPQAQGESFPPSGEAWASGRPLHPGCISWAPGRGCTSPRAKRGCQWWAWRPLQAEEATSLYSIAGVNRAFLR